MIDDVYCTFMTVKESWNLETQILLMFDIFSGNLFYLVTLSDETYCDVADIIVLV